jgi:hypothetical protein
MLNLQNGLQISAVGYKKKRRAFHIAPNGVILKALLQKTVLFMKLNSVYHKHKAKSNFKK